MKNYNVFIEHPINYSYQYNYTPKADKYDIYFV